MRHTSSRRAARRNGAAVLASAAAALSALLVSAPAAHAVDLFALTTTNNLYRFDTLSGTTTFIGALNLGTGISALSIDFRATNGVLYALGSDGGTAGGIYTVNPSTGVGTLVPGSASISLTLGTSYEIDFNPVPNALRVVGSNGQNLRITNTTDTQNLSTLNNDGAYPVGFSPVATAYSNNDTNTGTGTTQYVINDANDTLVQVGTPNDPAAGTLNSLGTLGVAITGAVGFDIFTDAAGNNSAFLGVGSTLYSLSLENAGTTSLGSLALAAGDTGTIRGLSAATVPEPGTMALVGLMALPAAGALAARRRRTKAAAAA